MKILKFHDKPDALKMRSTFFPMTPKSITTQHMVLTTSRHFVSKMIRGIWIKMRFWCHQRRNFSNLTTRDHNRRITWRSILILVALLILNPTPMPAHMDIMYQIRRIIEKEHVHKSHILSKGHSSKPDNLDQSTMRLNLPITTVPEDLVSTILAACNKWEEVHYMTAIDDHWPMWAFNLGRPSRILHGMTICSVYQKYSARWWEIPIDNRISRHFSVHHHFQRELLNHVQIPTDTHWIPPQFNFSTSFYIPGADFWTCSTPRIQWWWKSMWFRVPEVSQKWGNHWSYSPQSP